MSIVLQTETPPLRLDKYGALRVGQSNLLLEIVIRSFENGMTPETIKLQYPTATLADIYSVIGYYLRHREEVQSYLMDRDIAAAEIRQRLQPLQNDLSLIRQRLQTRRNS